MTNGSAGFHDLADAAYFQTRFWCAPRTRSFPVRPILHSSPRSSPSLLALATTRYQEHLRLQPSASGRVRRLWNRSRSGLAGRWDDRRDGQQLCHTPHRRDGGFAAREASGADRFRSSPCCRHSQRTPNESMSNDQGASSATAPSTASNSSIARDVFCSDGARRHRPSHRRRVLGESSTKLLPDIRSSREGSCDVTVAVRGMLSIKPISPK